MRRRGWNVLPIAVALPKARVVGVDLSERQIALGRERARRLGLTNVELVRADLDDLKADLGELDYVTAHGVYSWISPDLQEQLLRTCHDLLAPDGLACVSYNTFPGWHFRLVLSEMARYRAAGATDPKEMLEKAREILGLIRSVGASGDPNQAFLAKECEALEDNRDEYLFHELLEEHNSPCSTGSSGSSASTSSRSAASAGASSAAATGDPSQSPTPRPWTSSTSPPSSVRWSPPCSSPPERRQPSFRAREPDHGPGARPDDRRQSPGRDTRTRRSRGAPDGLKPGSRLFLGPNGSGKSTTIRILTGLLALTRKELLQLRRETISIRMMVMIVMIVMVPIMQTLIFGYAINYDVKHTRIPLPPPRRFAPAARRPAQCPA